MIDIALLLLRVALGLVFIRHGLPKIKNPKWAVSMGVPAPLSIIGSVIEFFGGIGIILGFMTELATTGIALMMISAIYFHIVKWKHPFYAKEGKSYEQAFTLLIISIALLILGPGAYSLDALV